MPINYRPDGYHTITPYLVVPGVAQLLEFLKQTFDAQVTECMTSPDGRVMHAEARIGDSVVMMSEPRDGQPMTATLYLYVEDCDAVYQRALAAGAESVSPPADQFYGDRHAGVKDAFGNQWWMATRVEDVPLDEMKRRAEAYGRKSAA